MKLITELLKWVKELLKIYFIISAGISNIIDWEIFASWSKMKHTLPAHTPLYYVWLG